MRKVTESEFEEILEDHELWIDTAGEEGRRADLSKVDFSGANLRRAYLSRANLTGANLSGANLTRAILSRANLSGADLSGANLYEASLWRTDLTEADLRVATAKDCYIFNAKFSSPEDRARLLMLGATEE